MNKERFSDPEPAPKPLRLLVKVTPGASKTQARGWHEGALRIAVAAPPDKGRANSELIRFLSEQLQLSKSSVILAKGATSRLKELLIEGSSQEQIERLFGRPSP